MKLIAVLVSSILLFSGALWAETAEELRVRIGQKPTVVSCQWARNKHPQSLANHGELYYGVLEWYYIDANVMKKGTGEVGIVLLGTPQEAAYWAHTIPEIDRVIVAETYFGESAVTAAQIETFANSRWVAANPTATAIRDFSVQGLNPTTVALSGLFDVSGTRERRSYLIWLIDPLGPVNAANAKFERIIE